MPVTYEVVTPESPIAWMSTAPKLGRYFLLIDPATVPIGGDWPGRCATRLISLAREGKVRSHDDHGTPKFDPEEVAADLAALDPPVNQVMAFPVDMLRPESRPKVKDPLEVAGEIARRDSESIPDPTRPKKGEYREPNCSALKPVRSGPGCSGSVHGLGSHSFQADPNVRITGD